MKPPQDNTPPAGLTTLPDVSRWYTCLQVLHARLASHFARPEPYARALRFVQGILSPAERKNGWQLAEQAREATPYGMQRLLSQAVWDADGVRDDIRAFALQQVGSRHVIVAIDETGFLIMYHQKSTLWSSKRTWLKQILLLLSYHGSR